MVQEIVKALERFMAANWCGVPVAAWMAVGLVIVTGVVCVILAVRVRRVRVGGRKEVQVELGLCPCRDERERGRTGKV